MHSQSIPVDVSWIETVGAYNATHIPLPYLAAVLLAVLVLSTYRHSQKKDVMLNPNSPWELTSRRAKKEFISGAYQMIDSWFNKNPRKSAQVMADVGEMKVLPPHMADEIRNEDRLSFARWIFVAFHGNIPGFEGFREGSRDSGIVKSAILRDLTKHLNKVTEPLAAETAFATSLLLSENREWHSIDFKDTMLQLIARVSSRVFLGDLLCRDEEWLRITRDYTTSSFIAAEELRLWPAPLRPVVHWFLPKCGELRALVQKAREVVLPVLEERRRQKMSLSQTESEQSKVFDDAIEWFETAANGRPYDPVCAQLMLSTAAIHTTTDLTCQTMTQIVLHPEIIAPLRKEIVDVLQEHGWKKTALFEMKLLDSVIKESQRTKPSSIVVMRRLALDHVKLSDGTVIPKNSQVCVTSRRMWDGEIHENPDKFDPYRFYNMRQEAENHTKAQLVVTTPDHLAFGHGKQACPGRFFAANEIKIVLIYLLLRYDWKIAEGRAPQIQRSGMFTLTDPQLKMMVRRRQEEMAV
ncbi:Dihydromonacolin L monooxygenase mokC [Talaromyces pinophilus]|nr:Dihydromonacolin L monooxygenase mokC [Talaromyces pinophilus]